MKRHRIVSAAGVNEYAVVVSGHEVSRGVRVSEHCTYIRGVTEHYKPYRTEPNVTQSEAIDRLG